MSAPSFTYSGNVYTAGTAGTVDFALTSTTGNPIPYLEPGHIHVYKSSNQGTSWTELTRPAQWDFVTSGTVARLVTGIAAGEWVKVQRITPSSAAYVTFQPSSLLTADQLNDDTLFNTYLNQELYDQGNQSAAIAASAETAAASATTAATTATATANAASATAATALSTANTASTNASAAVSTANTASTNASSAVSTANTASTNATAALNAANTASTNASAAVTTANTASTNATSAVNTSNTAASNASTALTQSNTALTQSSTALSESSTALSQSSTALSQSSTALSNSNTAVSTANTANTNATAALNAVAAAVQYVLVANVAAIPASPANGYAIEVVDSTGIESFSPVASRPAGFVGDLGLSVRLQYSTTGSTWNWLGYFANNPENRYLKLSGGTLTGQLKADDSTSTAAPVYAFDGDTDTGVAHTGANEIALVTGGTTRLTIDGSGNVNVGGALTKGSNNVVTVGDTGTVTDAMLAGSISPSKITGTAVVTNDSRLTDTRTPTDGSVSTSKIVDGAVTSAKIADGTIVNADVNASAAIAGTKISPDFGSQNVTTTGTATAAALIPSGSSVPTNGVYLPSANNVAISTNGTGRLFVDASGRVGVGSSSPQSLLHLETDGTALRIVRGSAIGFVYNTGTAATDAIRIQSNGGSVDLYSPAGQPVTFSAGGTEKARITSDGRLGLGTSSPGAKAEVVTSGSETSLILRNSSLAPATYSEIKFAPFTGTTAASASIRTTYYQNNDSDLAFRTTNVNAEPVTRLYIGSGGNVGIGTTSPTSNLHVSASSGEATVRVTNTGANSSWLVFQPGSTGNAYVHNEGNSSTLFTTNGTERARIDNSGRLLVGTTTTSAAPLTVNGTVEANGSLYRAVFGNGYLDGDSSGVAGGNAAEVQIQSASSSRPATLSLGGGQGSGELLGAITFFNSNNTDGKRLRASITAGQEGATANAQGGLLTFSTTADGASSPRSRLIIPHSGASTFWAPNSAFNSSSGSGAGTTDSVFTGWYGGTSPDAANLGTISIRIWNNGNIVNANNSYGSLSDIKLKENIVDAGSQWDDLKALQVRKYNFKEGQTHTQIGLIAQEVELISPGLVNESPDRDEEGNDLGTTTKSVNYSVLYMKAVKALQEAMERIETLEAKVAAIEGA